ncbi:flagellin [Xinfangfangia sp. CPCC 101601]|uniref:Flagellin n=1 Tax=Pseudogemmobacter lacusdianii TaxID=3069608 RepID=A0ABU0VVS3_9RHOB|nr:flagellin [Xinfangfangia sp. CPCC 101601]MDQ2065335.1 flagellin [Xinfangfangia sp. CPCC 101601]
MVIGVGHGDTSLTAMLARQSRTLRAEIDQRTSEISTGLHRDLGAALGGDFSAIAGIEQSLARLRGYTTNTHEAALYTDIVQVALAVVNDGATELGANILRNLGPGSETSQTTLGIEARRIFQTTVAALNTRFANRAVFSGIEADAPPLPGPDEILAELEGAIAAATTVEDLRLAVAHWFNDPGGFDAFYGGGPPRADVMIAEGEMASISVTARDPALKGTLQALSIAALLDRGALAGQPEARANLFKSVGDDLLANGEARSELMARVGSVQAQIVAAQARNGAEKSGLEITRAGLVGVDHYETAARLEDLQTRLEALFLVTSRVARLSLVDYIR